MNLTLSEIALFYKLWYSLIWSINEKYKVIPCFKKPEYGTRVSVNVEEFMKVRNAMWDNPERIDEFLCDHDNGEFTEQERGIITEWRKHFVKGKFLIIKHLTKYSVLMTFEETPNFLYGVCGISDPVKDSMPYPIPFLADLVLLPFGDKIIYDSLAAVNHISFGSGMRSNMKKWYDEAKEKYGIIEVLNGEIPVCQPQSEKPEKKTVKAKQVPAGETAVPEGVKVPKVMAAKYNEIAEIISQFSDEKLNEEYKEITLRALAKLCRKRPSPLEKGRARTWACGIVYAIGSNNFIFDKSQPINITAAEIAEWFGLAKGTASSKASEVTKILGLSYANPEFLLESVIEGNPAIWYLDVDGLIMDIRTMPREYQEAAFRKGLIPYIPDDKN
ncbi:MAG: DUF6398 domain-containing protein [Eubacteriales bacterium]